MKTNNHLIRASPKFESAIMFATKSEKRKLRKNFWKQGKEERERRERDYDFFPVQAVEKADGAIEYRFEDGAVVEVEPNKDGKVVINSDKRKTSDIYRGYIVDTLKEYASNMFGVKVQQVKSVEYTSKPYGEGEKTIDSYLGDLRLAAINRDLEKRAGKSLFRKRFSNDGLTTAVFGLKDIPGHDLVGKLVGGYYQIRGYEQHPRREGSMQDLIPGGEVLVRPKSFTSMYNDLNKIMDEFYKIKIDKN